MTSTTASSLVEALSLAPHPEGGFYRETVRTAQLTSMLYLLPRGAFSAFHRVHGSDEVWVHHAGGEIELVTIDDDGTLATVRLAAGGPQHVVAAGSWQAAAAVGDWALCGCVVAPPFAFERLEMPPRAELLARFPGHAETITRLTR